MCVLCVCVSVRCVCVRERECVRERVTLFDKIGSQILTNILYIRWKILVLAAAKKRSWLNQNFDCQRKLDFDSVRAKKKIGAKKRERLRIHST